MGVARHTSSSRASNFLPYEVFLQNSRGSTFSYNPWAHKNDIGNTERKILKDKRKIFLDFCVRGGRNRKKEMRQMQGLKRKQ
jgi:hypothetical protein